MRKLTRLCTLLVSGVVLSLTTLGGAEVQSGDPVTTVNLGQADGLLTPASRWMVKQGMSLSIIETRKVNWPTAYQQATDEYAEQVTLSEDGRELGSYVAGSPFPIIDPSDPLAGFKIMWNAELGPYDNWGVYGRDELVNSKGEIEREYESSMRWMKWMGRLYLDPKPIVPHDPPLLSSILWGPYVYPQNLRGFLLLHLRYLSPDVPNETYRYLPAERRVRRIPFANWQQGITKLSYFTFRVLAEKTILAVMHSGKYGDSSAWCAPRDGTHGWLAALPCVSWEKRKVWIIEARVIDHARKLDLPSGKSDLHNPDLQLFDQVSNLLVYVDQDVFMPVLTEIYDEQGELWRFILPCFLFTTEPYVGYPAQPMEGSKYNYKDEWPFLPNQLAVDIQEGSAWLTDAPVSTKKPVEWHTEWYFNEKVVSNTPEVYSVNYLSRKGR